MARPSAPFRPGAHVRAWRPVAFGASAGLAALAPARDAPASEPPPAHEGFEAAASAGYARPFGGLQSQHKLRLAAEYAHEAPFRLDLGYRFDDTFYLGAFASVAGGAPGTAFDDLCVHANCRVTGYHFGIFGAAHLRPAARLDPWLGFGFGYELATLAVDESGDDVARRVRGFELAQLALGADWRLTRELAVGPLLQASFGFYSHSAVWTPRYDREWAIADTDVHGWLTVSMRMLVQP